MRGVGQAGGGRAEGTRWCCILTSTDRTIDVLGVQQPASQETNRQ